MEDIIAGYGLGYPEGALELVKPTGTGKPRPPRIGWKRYEISTFLFLRVAGGAAERRHL